MPVRCRGCRVAASEWAARCPRCHASLHGAEWISEPANAISARLAEEPKPASVSVPAARHETRPPRRGRRPIPVRIAALVAVAAVAALGFAVTGVLGSHPSGTPSGHPHQPVVPADLAQDQVAYVSGGNVALAGLGGPSLSSAAVVASNALWADKPVAVDGGAVFVGNGSTYGTARYIDASGHIVTLAPASALFTGGPHQVGVVVPSLEGRPGPAEVQVLTFSRGGAHPAFRATAPVVLPPGAMAEGALPDGRLALRSDTNDLVVWSPQAGPIRTLGNLDQVVAVSDRFVAWTSATGCSSLEECPLHLFDLASGTDRSVAPPGGRAGFVDGGAFSPDGRVLAAFVARDDRSAGSVVTIQPVLIDPLTATATLSGVGVPSVAIQGQPVGSAAWTPDGRWLVFAGLRGLLVADRAPNLPATARAGGTGPPRSGPSLRSGSSLRLQLPGSIAFTVLSSAPPTART